MFACWPSQVGKAVKCVCFFLCYGHRHIYIKLCSAVFERRPMSDLTLVLGSSSQAVTWKHGLWCGLSCHVCFHLCLCGWWNKWVHAFAVSAFVAALGLEHSLVCGDASRCQNFVASSLYINVPVYCICLRVLKQSPVIDLLIMYLCGVLG